MATSSPPCRDGGGGGGGGGRGYGGGLGGGGGGRRGQGRVLLCPLVQKQIWRNEADGEDVSLHVDGQGTEKTGRSG